MAIQNISNSKAKRTSVTEVLNTYDTVYGGGVEVRNCNTCAIDTVVVLQPRKGHLM